MLTRSVEINWILIKKLKDGDRFSSDPDYYCRTPQLAMMHINIVSTC